MNDSLPNALVMGGTADTAPLAQALAGRGYRVIVSMFSDAPLDLGNGSGVVRRSGPLDVPALLELLYKENVVLAVDALHPYAEAGHQTCALVAAQGGCRWLRLAREASDLPSNVLMAENHAAAVDIMRERMVPTFFTIGSRFLRSYVPVCRELHIPFLARVLDDTASLQVCAELKLSDEEFLAARGPFSIQDNLRLIDRLQAKLLVTKDGGVQGGMTEKLHAAQLRNCHVLVVGRPICSDVIQMYNSVDRLMEAV